MSTEELNIYRDNLQSFTDRINNSIVERIIYNIDDNPTFNKETIPFKFKYCNSIQIITDKDCLDIRTSMTDGCLETFWIVPSTEIKAPTHYMNVNSRVIKIESKDGYDNFPFKILIEFEKGKLILYAGEIYDEADGILDYKINDEMILAFEDEKDAGAFEKMLNYA